MRVDARNDRWVSSRPRRKLEVRSTLEKGGEDEEDGGKRERNGRGTQEGRLMSLTRIAARPFCGRTQ
jgi:hypothetical protein